MRWSYLLLLTTSLLYSAPAFNSARKFHQPDGTTFIGKQRGDEYLHWIESDSGDILLFNKKSKRFEHTEIVGDALKANGTVFHRSKKGRRIPSGLHKDAHEAIKDIWLKKRREEVERKRDVGRQ